MTGAVHLAGRAALRAGAGLVTLAVPAAIHAIVAAGVTSAMTRPFPSTPTTGGFSAEGLAEALDAIDDADAFAIGPGLGMDPATRWFVAGVASRGRAPGVIDADALSHLAVRGPKTTLEAPAARVITPHPGEAGRLLGLDAAAVQSDRETAVTRLREEWGVVALLKGAGTLIAGPDGGTRNETGNPGMATAGSGDVLTGLLAGFLSQGIDPFDAAVLAAWVHGRAGDLAAARTGETALVADDILDALPAAIRERESDS